MTIIRNSSPMPAKKSSSVLGVGAKLLLFAIINLSRGVL